MTDIAVRAVAQWLQWGLLAGFTIVALAAMVDGRRTSTRRVSVAVAFIAVPHAAYYALFLIWPDALGALGTMMFSIALRYQPLAVAALLLVLAHRKPPWKR